MHRTNHSTTYYSWFKIMKHYFSLILKSYSLSLSLSLSVKSLYAILKSFFFYWILFSQSDSVNLQNVRYTSEQTRTEEWVWYVDSSGSCVVCEENARFRDEIVDEKSNFLCFSVFEDDTWWPGIQIKIPLSKLWRGTYPLSIYKSHLFVFVNISTQFLSWLRFSHPHTEQR